VLDHVQIRRATLGRGPGTASVAARSPSAHEGGATLEEFAPRFISGHAVANRQKPSGVAAKETILDTHLKPLLGSRRLDAITTEQVQRLKHALKNRAPKTVNNVLTTLSVLLKKAVEWDVIDRMPCSIRLLPIPKASAGFYDFDDYERLIQNARDTDVNAYVIVLLGGEAGLRCGEIMALEWNDVDLGKRQVRVQRSDWKGNVTATKGGRVRFVPMTARLATALREHRHLRCQRVLCQRDGSPLTQKIVQDHVGRAARRANVRPGVHILRHTFCSHLAMKGARRPSGTCTSAQRPWRAQFVCWIPREASSVGAIAGQREKPRSVTRLTRTG